MIDFILQYWVEFLLGLVTTGLLLAVKILYKRISALMKGTQSLLRAELIRSGEKYDKRGWVEIYAKDAFDKAYCAYHNLGQNGTMDELHDRVMDLPTSPQEKRL